MVTVNKALFTLYPITVQVSTKKLPGIPVV